MPEIAGLSAGEILFEAVRQEIWCSRCHSEKVGGLKFNHLPTPAISLMWHLCKFCCLISLRAHK